MEEYHQLGFNFEDSPTNENDLQVDEQKKEEATKLKSVDKSTTEKPSKEEKRILEKQKLLENVIAGNISSNKEKVAFILNSYPAARNSDIDLAWLYWKTFEGDIFKERITSKEQLRKLTRYTSITRDRAKIQNEYKLFEADDKIKEYREVLEGKKRDEAIEDKPPGLPLLTVFVDETGKTDNFLGVGSLWLLDSSRTLETNTKILEWKKRKGIEFEFHFAKVSKHRLDDYKEFFIKFLSLNSTVGFKAIIVNNIGFKNLNDPITDLTFHLIHKGVLHEHESGRASLPRNLQVWLDEEEKGSDNLKLENLKERLKAQKMDDLYFGNFEAIVSTSNYYIQAVDLFISSINRKLNSKSDKHFKDELADFILDTLQFDISNLDSVGSDIDKSKIFNLTYKAKD